MQIFEPVSSLPELDTDPRLGAAFQIFPFCFYSNCSICSKISRTARTATWRVLRCLNSEKGVPRISSLVDLFLRDSQAGKRLSSPRMFTLKGFERVFAIPGGVEKCCFLHSEVNCRSFLFSEFLQRFWRVLAACLEVLQL